MSWENVVDNLQPIMDALPALFGALLLGIAGLILATILARVTRWVVKVTTLDALAERFGLPKILYRLGIKMAFGAVLGRVVFLAVMVLTLSAMAETVGLPGLARVTASIVGLLPRLIVALVIGALGGVSADLLRRVIQRSGDDEDDSSRRALGEVAYYTTLVVAIAIALEQAGLRSDLVTVLIIMVTAVAVLTVAVAFLIGGRAVLPHYAARLYYQPLLHRGDLVKLNDVQGRVARTTATSLVLTDEGGAEIVVPFSALLQGVVHIERAP